MSWVLRTPIRALNTMAYEQSVPGKNVHNYRASLPEVFTV